MSLSSETSTATVHTILCPIETSIGKNCGGLQLRDEDEGGDGATCGVCHAHNVAAPGARCTRPSLKGKAYCRTHANARRRRVLEYSAAEDEEGASMSEGDDEEDEEDIEEKENGGVSRTRAVRRAPRRHRKRGLQRAVLAPTLPARELRSRQKGLSVRGPAPAPLSPVASATAACEALTLPSPTHLAANSVYEKVMCYEWDGSGFRRSGQGLLCLESHSFACGGMRMAFHAKLKQSAHDATQRQVIKIGIEAEENDRDTVEGEAEASFRARFYADLYNSYPWSKKVEFLPVSVIQMVERRGPFNFATMEQDLSEHGGYYKWNDNDGLVGGSVA